MLIIIYIAISYDTLLNDINRFFSVFICLNILLRRTWISKTNIGFSRRRDNFYYSTFITMNGVGWFSRTGTILRVWSITPLEINIFRHISFHWASVPNNYSLIEDWLILSVYIWAFDRLGYIVGIYWTCWFWNRNWLALDLVRFAIAVRTVMHFRWIYS